MLLWCQLGLESNILKSYSSKEYGSGMEFDVVWKQIDGGRLNAWVSHQKLYSSSLN